MTKAEVGPADVLSLDLRAPAPVPEGSTLVLRHRRQGDDRAAPLPSASAEVELHPLALRPGLWDAYLRAGEDETKIRSVDPGFSLDALDVYALRPREISFLAYRTQGGHLALRVREATPAVDVRAVWLREGRFEVTGLLVFTGLTPGAVRRDAALLLDAKEVPATVEGVRFHAAVSLVDLIEHALRGDLPLSLRVEDLPGDLRLGARLDDVPGKRRRLRYPPAVVDGVPLRFFYDEREELWIGAERGAG
ncbi:hypothetical protein [Bailinhaonella thermotolerans]|uniref:hypothetical protein n=1 Tax=Bailinhaonella thermotolerans TaxID=1070861 RepID=UPI001F5B686C|nr:hypothetical protein [Bailinhaonella thermotolerans]